MEFSIKTETFQEMVGKVVKCATNNKLIPITSLLSIKVEDNTLYLTTTDAVTYFYVKSKLLLSANGTFEVSVLADTFSKLIQKTTSADITVKYDETNFKLQVIGNGTYTIELPLDENGKPIKFPITDTSAKVKCGTLNLNAVKSALTYNKVALSDNVTYPALTQYYCGDSIISTNQVKVCANNEKVFDTPKLISPTLMELLGVLTGETVEVFELDKKLIFETDCEYIIHNVVVNIEDFPVDSINNLVNSDFEAKCTISKDVVLNILDRLSLFMSSYDNKGIDLTVTANGIVLQTIAGSGVEIVPFISTEKFIDYHCRINVEILRGLLSTYETDNVEFSYGNPVAIKLSAGKITQIAALMEE